MNKSEFGRFELNIERGQLHRNGKRVRMRHQTFKLLCCLADNDGEVVSRKRLAERLWGTADIDFDQRLNAAIGNLRKTLNDNSADPRYVITVPGQGYRFAGKISRASATRQAAPFGQTNKRRAMAALAAAVLIAITVGGTRLLDTVRQQPAPVSDAARNAYIEAKTLIEKGDAAALSRAGQLLQDAVAASPQYADAWAATAELWCDKPLPAAEKMPQAKTAALTALEHDAGNTQAQLRLAEIAISWDRDWHLAQDYLISARDADPGNASVHHAVASLRYLQGRLGEAEAAMLMSVAIEPLSIVLNTDLAWYYTASGKYDKAIATCELLARVEDPPAGPGGGNTCTLQPLLLSGQVEAAAGVARQALERATGYAPGAALAADTVLTLFWRHMLGQLTEAAEVQYVDPVHFARMHAQLGDQGGALDALAQAVKQRSQLAPFIHLFPEFRALHENRTFVALLQEAGMPEDPRQVLARLP